MILYPWVGKYDTYKRTSVINIKYDTSLSDINYVSLFRCSDRAWAYELCIDDDYWTAPTRLFDLEEAKTYVDALLIKRGVKLLDKRMLVMM